MDRIKRRRPSPAMVVALISLFVALGGVAYAANTVGSADVIDNSLLSQDLHDGGGVKGVDVATDSLTGADIAESTLGKVPNANNLDGKDSSQFATNLWAVFGYVGGFFDMARDHGATASGRISAGTYFVRFNRDITNCAYIATPGQVGDVAPPPPLAVSVGQRDATSTPNDVLVRVFGNTSNSPTDFFSPDDAFYLAVLC